MYDILRRQPWSLKLRRLRSPSLRPRWRAPLPRMWRPKRRRPRERGPKDHINTGILMWYIACSMKYIVYYSI